MLDVLTAIWTVFAGLVCLMAVVAIVVLVIEGANRDLETRQNEKEKKDDIF